MHARQAMVGLFDIHDPGGDMKPDWEVLAELGVFLDLDPDKEDIAAAAFDRLGFPRPAAHYAPNLVRQLVLDLERRHEASVVVREYQEDGLGLLYYEVDAADGDEDTRLVAARHLVQEVAGSVSATFVGPWP
jgi:hypothetical protein